MARAGGVDGVVRGGGVGVGRVDFRVGGGVGVGVSGVGGGGVVGVGGACGWC